MSNAYIEVIVVGDSADVDKEAERRDLAINDLYQVKDVLNLTRLTCEVDDLLKVQRWFRERKAWDWDDPGYPDLSVLEYRVQRPPSVGRALNEALEARERVKTAMRGDFVMNWDEAKRRAQVAEQYMRKNEPEKP